MLFFIGLVFGLLIAYMCAVNHFEKRLQKAFWLWVQERNIKGIIDKDAIKELNEEFDSKTKGIITIEKNK